MDKDILLNTNNTISISSLEDASKTLVSHCKNKSHFSISSNKIATGGIDSSDYTNRGIKRSKFLEKQFIKTKFINSAAAGSIFNNCIFQECLFKNANFQECTFPSTHILNHTGIESISNCNFNISLFTDKFSINNTLFEHCVFHNTAFFNGTIENTTFYSSTLTDAHFSNVILKDIKFSDLNIDYAVFENIKMENVILPFSQVCYTFGLLTYLLNTNDSVYILSENSKQGYISPKEYLNLLPEFEIYYAGVHEYFPLANIYLAYNKKEKAREVILEGILKAITDFDFRGIKYLCKLIYTYPIFNFHERKNIYDYMNEHISFSNMNNTINYKYKAYKNEIESYLLNNNKSGIITAEIDISTGIYPDNFLHLGILLSTLEEIVENGKSEYGEHKIICRHNSPEEISLIIQETYQALQIIIPTIYSIILGALVLEEKVYAHKKLQREKCREVQLLNIEEERTYIKLEREKLALEREKAEFKEYQNELTKKKTN